MQLGVRSCGHASTLAVVPTHGHDEVKGTAGSVAHPGHSTPADSRADPQDETARDPSLSAAKSDIQSQRARRIMPGRAGLTAVLAANTLGSPSRLITIIMRNLRAWPVRHDTHACQASLKAKACGAEASA
jgi:hypothetical protein